MAGVVRDAGGDVIDIVEETLSSSTSRFSNLTALHVAPGRAVFTAYDRLLDNRTVAVKCRMCHRDSSDRLLQHAVALRQLTHRNIATIYDAFCADSYTADGVDAGGQTSPVSVYIVQELMDVELRSLIASGQVTVSHCRLFTHQLLTALRFAHGAGIIHCGLKPSNVLVSCQQLVLKLADFQFARLASSTPEPGKLMAESPTDSVDAHWYHAPELLLRVSDTTSAVDVWSAGCIVAEMLIGQPLFRGANLLDQLLKLIDTVHLSDDDWTRVLRVMPNKLLKNHPFRPRSPLRTQLSGVDRQVIHLLEMLLMFNAAERLTADEALSHVYFADCQHLSDTDSTAVRSAVTSTAGYEVRSSSSESLSGSTLLPTDALDYHSNVSPAVGGPRCGDDVALKNFRNYQNRVASPTVDRTPSPHILDLLDGSTHAAGCRVGKQRRELSESDGEKDVADISDEKMREDLEVGNVSVELLRRICDEVVTGQVVLSTTPPTAHRLPDVNELLPEADENISVQTAAEQEDSFNEMFNRNLQLSGHTDQNPPRSYDEQFLKNADHSDGPLKDSLSVDVDGKDSAFNDGDWKKTNAPFGTRDKFSEDSNKLGFGGGDAEVKMKSGTGQDSRTENTASQFADGPVSRKLILDKIETEKRRGRRRRSGSGARMTGLTSEEFDELYRLPTEHLRKERQGGGERNSRSTAPTDRNHHHHRHRHHSHDSYAAGGRHALTDDDWSYRADVEGACGGGADYYCYDDMMMTHATGIEFDIDSAPPHPTRRPLDLSSGVGTLQFDDFIDTSLGDAGFPRRRYGVVTRDNSSSPESPAGLQSGARPKKSPKKHRAL